MIKTIFHFFKIHRKMIFGNPSIIIQDMFGVTPESFNAVDMVLAAIGKGFAVIQAMMLPQPFQGIVTAEGIRVIDRPFSRMLPDMSHQFIGGYLLHDFRINPPVALQKAKYYAFSGGTAPTPAFAPAAEVRFVNLNLAFELTGLKLGHMIDCFAQTLIDATHHLVIKAEIARHAIGWLLLIEAGDNANLFAQTFERLLFSTGRAPALYIAALSFTNLKRTAENALSAPQKVGRTVKNILLPSNHKGILTLRGYETH